MWLFTIRRNCSCSSFFVSDILYCCIKAMALSAESFTTGMVDAAIRKSWYEGSSHHFSGSFEGKLCTFSFSFNCRTSKMTVVLSVKQEARPAELRGSGGQTRRFTELVDCWIVEGRGLSPSVISHLLQPCHQTTTGRPKFPILS